MAASSVLFPTSALPKEEQEAVVVEIRHKVLLEHAMKNVAGVQAFLKYKKRHGKQASRKRALESSRVVYSMREMMACLPSASIPELPADLQSSAPGWASKAMGELLVKQ
eukprot:TRINITY_DN4542_c0_g3_i2.p1 TRINITY_DN4542_c0_g3~~TRINITY_DN4542_c0_g3_i2.p1  ORF type:complete len:116 (+),score=35.86 TRINITY_DN4542_c0_g3_i2:23-349(+)